MMSLSEAEAILAMDGIAGRVRAKDPALAATWAELVATAKRTIPPETDKQRAERYRRVLAQIADVRYRFQATGGETINPTAPLACEMAMTALRGL